MPDPIIKKPSDALVKVSHSALCGSDLHPYRGLEKGLDPGTVMGHELVGDVVEVGSQVKDFKKGDRVCAPFTTNCGSCRFCLQGLTCRCREGQLLGWQHMGVGLHGSQAEFIRIPLADNTLLKVPEELSSETALLVGDNLATGYYAALQAEVSPGKLCVVIGCGAVGLMTILAAGVLGADMIYAIDPLPGRRQQAEFFGATSLPPEQAVSHLLEATSGDGIECVIEAVGNQSAQRLAYDLVAPGGVLSTVGVHTGAQFAFTPGDLYDRNLTFKVGRCPARALAQKVLPLAIKYQDKLATLFTHRFSLAQGPEAYQLFDSRGEGCVKVLLHPPFLQ